MLPRQLIPPERKGYAGLRKGVLRVTISTSLSVGAIPLARSLHFIDSRTLKFPWEFPAFHSMIHVEVGYRNGAKVLFLTKFTSLAGLVMRPP